MWDFRKVEKKLVIAMTVLSGFKIFIKLSVSLSSRLNCLPAWG